MIFAMHAGIVCLHFACWDSMSGFPGDWLLLTSAYSRVSVVSLAVIGGYLSFVPQWDVNPIMPNIA